VWRQLLDHCKQQDDDLVVRHAAWQAAAYEAQLEQLRQRLDAQEQQMAALQQQVAALTQPLQP
jgi:cell division protein FtsB